MRVIVIDVEKKDVYDLDIAGTNLSIQAVVGARDIVPICELDNGDTLYVDRKATDKPIEDVKGAFSFQEYPKSLVFSNGVIVGSDRKTILQQNGSTASHMTVADAGSDLDSIKEKILFPNRAAFEDGYKHLFQQPVVIEESWT